MAGAVTKNLEDEETLKKKIIQLREQERKLRKERQRLEAELRELIFKKYLELEEEIG